MSKPIIDCFKGHSNNANGWLYVVLSRVKALNKIFLIQPLSSHMDNYTPRYDVEAEN